MLEFLYRFRTVKNLLGPRDELRTQQIYLASSEQLNDPAEGHRIFEFIGDPVLWRNLLRHYTLALLCQFTLAKLTTDGEWKGLRINAHLSADELPTESMRGIYREIVVGLFRSEEVQEVLHILPTDGTPVGHEALLFLLRLVHQPALKAMSDVLAPLGLTEALETKPELKSKALENLRLLRSAIRRLGTGQLEQLAKIGNAMNSGVDLSIEIEGGGPVEVGRRMDIISRFPAEYLRTIERDLVHPRWRTACFSETCSNASNWSAYGDEHRGIALKFRLEESEGRVGLTCRGRVGVRSDRNEGQAEILGDRFYPLQPVRYGGDAPVVDFFRFLGRLPERKFHGTWLTDEGGRTSERLGSLFSDKGGWRSELWDSFERAATRKLADWAHELEHRIVVTELMGVGMGNLIEYKFESLTGIVFGARTRREDKVKVIAAVSKKCTEVGRREFEFWEARFDAEGKMWLSKLLLPEFGT